MTIHLPGGRSVPRNMGGDGATWVDLDALESAGIEVKELGEGKIGLCPSAERCIPVPDDARRGVAIDLGALAEALGLVIADDGRHAVVRRGPDTEQVDSELEVGGQFDLRLPDLDGDEQPLAASHGRSAVFAWASW